MFICDIFKDPLLQIEITDNLFSLTRYAIAQLQHWSTK